MSAGAGKTRPGTSGTRAGSRLLLLGLAVVFSAGLTYASLELPRLANELLAGAFDTHRDPASGIDLFPEADSGRQPEVTEAFFRSFHVRAIGYTSFGLVLLMIVVGIVAERRKLAATGALALFLPVFGHFALNMFFLAGLGFLRTLWLPALDLNYGATGDLGHGWFGLGDAALVPYMAALYLGALARVDLRGPLPFVIMGLGWLLFMLGTAAWFAARFRREGTAERWVYRFGRHPQYLGWILWTYGLMTYFIYRGEGSHFKISWGIPDSLPWLVSAIIIAGVALLEEIRMRRERGAEYAAYMAATPFLVPLPRVVARAAGAPARLVLRKPWPETGRDVAVVLTVYLVLLVGLSWIVRAAGLPPFGRMDLFPYTLPPFR